MIEEKEFKAKLKNNSLILSDDAIEFLRELNTKEIKVKFLVDLDEICRKENISKKTVEKISATQRIPIEVAFGVIRSKGKITK